MRINILKSNINTLFYFIFLNPKGKNPSCGHFQHQIIFNESDHRSRSHIYKVNTKAVFTYIKTTSSQNKNKQIKAH